MAMFSLCIDFSERLKPLNTETQRHRGSEKSKRKARENKIAADKRFSLLLFFLRVSVLRGFNLLSRHQHLV
jgi:hypothetical protein